MKHPKCTLNPTTFNVPRPISTLYICTISSTRILYSTAIPSITLQLPFITIKHYMIYHLTSFRRLKPPEVRYLRTVSLWSHTHTQVTFTPFHRRFSLAFTRLPISLLPLTEQGLWTPEEPTCPTTPGESNNIWAVTPTLVLQCRSVKEGLQCP